ncbi:glycoside hydrolase [Putridiphycobacter roseus]|uniref:Glycoside hydrolase n=1 Tax=Putridiphycobacter roseus TaxID=2219161 RepID=A0A2W1MXC9_9FLAO|nr:glycoside hydrolase [Putridiphycobacter roseus]
MFIAQAQGDKINGVSIVSMRNTHESIHFEPIKRINANWVTVMPFAFIRNNAPNVYYNANFQWKGETELAITESIKHAHANHLKVMIKPHVWTHGGWIGDLTFNTEEDWLKFEKSYTSYILSFAKIAAAQNVAIFCVGVEIKKSVVQRPKFWINLIKEVRKVYKGKLTYAANWDNYENVSFWKMLDFIGIDAYFPLTEAKTPSFQNCFIGWEKHYKFIKEISKKVNKPVLFTEFGYRNIDYTGKEPWDEKQNNTFNSLGQENAFLAVFAKFWGESWFAGGFIWKWFPDHAESGGTANNRFTPQNKAVEKIIASFYGKFM